MAEGGEVLILIASSCKVIVLMTSHAMTSMSSAEWSNMTNSIAEYLSTPSGCMCPNRTQIVMMSSSCIEAASNRVPSPLVRTKMHVWLRRSTLSLGFDLSPLRQLLWTWWTLRRGKVKFAKNDTLDLENFSGYHRMRWNQQISNH